MANEAQVRSSIVIKSGLLEYSSKPVYFQANVAGSKGPTPGFVLVTTAGIEIDLSGIVIPGFCRIMNLDDVNYFQVGLWVSATFYDLQEVGPGETYVVKLSRVLGDLGATLGAKAVGAECGGVFEAFEK